MVLLLGLKMNSDLFHNFEYYFSDLFRFLKVYFAHLFRF